MLYSYINKMANELHVLAEVDNLNHQVFAPLKSTNRIKYTCFSVSKNFLIFGATSGGLYVFKREPCSFLQLVPNKEGSVTQVSTSPDEKLFAFGTLKGLVCVLEIMQYFKIRRIQMSVEHQGCEVTALHWNAVSNELFVGDDSGKISVVNVSPFMAKNMFQQPTFPLMQLDSRIVQLDWCSDLLLVSTTSRCYICDTFNEQYRQIGQKLRDGEYGACFFTVGEQSDLPARPEIKESTISGTFSSLNEGEKLLGYEGVKNLKILCARPGCRLWQVHVDGSVLSTHQFKHAFTVPPVEIIKLDEKVEQTDAVINSDTSLNFTKLYVIANKFVFTFKHDAMCVVDPVKGDVVLWTNVLKDIIDVKIVNDVLYIWTAQGNFLCVGFLPLDRFLIRLYLHKHYSLCARLCLEHNNYLLELAPRSSRLQLLADLDNKLDDPELSEKVSLLLQQIIKHVQEKQSAQRLKCGIFVVGNSQLFWDEEKESDETLKVEQSRSLSASPENVRKKKGSTLSLPELDTDSIHPFRELKHTFSWKIINTKSLKEKWQMLEDKMKLLNVENAKPLDVRPVDYQENVQVKKIVVEDLELVHCTTATLRQFPAIDISMCVELCKRLAQNKQSNMLAEFLDVFNNANNLLVSALMKDDLPSCSVGPFPFSYYFTEQIVTIIREHFDMAVSCGYLFTWIKNKQQEMQHVPLEQFPAQFEACCFRDTLKFDYLLSRILVIFSDIMDPDLILRCIKKEELPCYYLSVCVILDRYEEGSLQHTAHEEMALPVLLNTIFYMLRMERVDTCCKLAKQVCVKDVWYLVLRLAQHIEAAGKDKHAAKLHCYSLFLCFLDKMSASKDCLTELLPDDQLRFFVTYIFEELNYVDNGCCVCGFPLANPPVLPYAELAELMVVYYWENSQGRLLEMCKSVPSLWHLILPRKRSGDLSSVLPLIIHLGNATELINWMPCMTYEDWEKTVQLVVQFRGGTCLNCGSAFTSPDNQVKGILWSSLGPLLVKAVGPQKAIQLLSKYSSHIDPGELDERFFQTCIFSAIVDSHGVGLRNEVIDLLSEYTTKTADTATFSPTVAVSVEAALKDDLGKQVEFASSSGGHHWGVKVNLEDGNCPCCLLPLASPVLMKDGGVTTFRCGHSFHVVCLRRRSNLYSCPICTKNS